jgi:hypothetical protein
MYYGGYVCIIYIYICMYYGEYHAAVVRPLG